ncbi:poly polymerase catalytic domain-containing protein [Ilyonectria robusta]|uniref:poly polymerase catalytic domain-containing protein n=1 Tax=Ilyonectria robusta TaxID=1079257 RepID=UPI001E8EA056|nr:poly polymerase catalytic domain-containing protein [Ilyonectria robusta]KAH8733918.1 poly polymerase catalytic domain-containing protein [Ilyonectria robusta]
MAPRRKAAAAPPADPPLDGCAIALSGKFDAISHNHGSLEAIIRSHGGTVTKSVTKATTHVICTEDDFEAGTTKIAAAKAKDLPLVNPQWIVDVDSKKKKLSVDGYTWGAKQANVTKSKASTNGASKKRPAVAAKADDEEEEEEAEEEVQPKAKKARASRATASKATKATKATKASKADDEEEEEEEEEEDQPKAAPKTTKATKAAAPKAAKATKATKASKAKATVKDEPEENLEEEKIVAEGQFIKKKGIAIPLDEFCTLPTYQVYVDPSSGLIYDASLNQSNSSNNNNKFYRIQVLEEPKSKTFKAWTRWGRVGEPGTGVALGNGTLADAIKNFEKKFKDKSGLPWDMRGGDPKPGKYAFVERSYNPDDDDDEDEDDAKAVKKEDGDEEESAPPPECTLEKPVKELMELIFNQQFFNATMTSLNYDANKLPLGKLSKATITRGFQQLKDLAALMDDPTLAASKWNTNISAATEHLSNTYYSFIPHAFGRNRPPIIQNDAMLKKEIELLESLSDMKDAADIMKIDRKTRDTIHPIDRQFQGLGLEEMTPLKHGSNEFTQLSSYLNESRGSTHNVSYQVKDIFRIERQGETKRFDESPYTKIDSDRRLLWHGSRCTNFGGILSQGLRIAPPEAPVSGYMFGKGIYLADMSSKSAGYCASYISNGEALLLLCEAELGDPMQKLTNASYNAGEDAKKNGMYSTWGQGSMGPSKWVDASIAHESLKGIKMPDTTIKPGQTNVQGAGLYYNEYIVYDVAQVKLRYLLRVKM